MLQKENNQSCRVVGKHAKPPRVAFNADNPVIQNMGRSGISVERHPPDWIEPQLTRLVDDARDGPGWLHEIKYDGYRMHARIDGGDIRLLTRTGLVFDLDEDEETRLDAEAEAAIEAGNFVTHQRVAEWL
jgi:ATP-dependent DNA ligase